MMHGHATRRVEVQFAGAPPADPISRASGVSRVEVDGATVRCVVNGSFQPFLEALRGAEVLSMTATPLGDGGVEHGAL